MSSLVKVCECLEELKSTNSSKEKLAILTKYYNEQSVKEFFYLTYEPTVNYYIRNLKFLDGITESIDNIDLKLASHLLPIINRKVTGHAAKDYLSKLYESLNEQSKNILKLILNRDADCGVSVTTINKVWKNLILAPTYMRCSLLESSNIKKWNFKDGIFEQQKMDGMFCKAILKDYWKLYTRSGNLINISNKAMQGVLDELKTLEDNDFELHGELVVVDSENTIMPREIGNGVLNSINNGEYVGDMNVKFIVWDYVTNQDTKYKDRWNKLNDCIKNTTENSFVSICDNNIVYSFEDALHIYAQYLSQGFEGAVLKHPDHVWKDGTSKDVIKLKLTAEVELKISGYNEGNGKNANTFGSLICESSDKLLSVNISGFKDDVRKEIFDNFDYYNGKIVTVKANAIMKTPNEESYSLFLPRFLEHRQDKSEANSLLEIQEIFNNLTKK